MKLLNKVDEFLKNLSVFKFIIIITLGMLLSSTILGLLVDIFNVKISNVQPTFTQEHFVIEFLVAVIIAPLLETFIFQYGIIKISKKINFLKNNNLIIILISSLLFGLQHFYSLSYIVNTTFLGIFLAYAFVVYERKKVSPYWVVCTIHGLKNFISFSAIHIFKLIN
ncbi:CPBP family glutamic-type intramembrane protease [Clostridium tepidum]